MVNNKYIDAVVIASPPHTQKSLAYYSIKKNKHIFCEKPFTESFLKAKKLSSLLKKNKIANIVNYIFPEIDTWKILKKKLSKEKIVERIYLKWEIKSKFKKKGWKYKHSQGGGVLYNFACHSIYYLEHLFGKINCLNSEIFYKNKNFPYRLKSIFYFLSGCKAEVEINLFSKKKQIHELKIKTNKSTYMLRSATSDIRNKFRLKVLNIKKKKSKQFVSNDNKKNDFRIEPTYKNSIKFSEWILKRKINNPNFQDALRVHYILEAILKSSKYKKIFFLNN